MQNKWCNKRPSNVDLAGVTIYIYVCRYGFIRTSMVLSYEKYFLTAAHSLLMLGCSAQVDSDPRTIELVKRHLTAQVESMRSVYT